MIELKNERLRVQIAEPGTVYRRTRFDWSGFVVQATLDEMHTFCVPEALREGEGTGGIGLCSEFGLMRPIGFDEARAGECFPKLGVGVLTKPEDKEYEFARDYPCQPFAIEIETRDDRAIFQVAPLPCRGYAARLTKTLELRENALLITCELENVGERALQTHEYNHNFVAINGAAPGPDYALKLAPEIALQPAPPLSLDGDAIRWRAPLQEAAGWGADVQNAGGDWRMRWELTHEPSGIALRESGDFPLERFGLWCAPHCICPEVFADINVAPGATQKWTRRYDFLA